MRSFRLVPFAALLAWAPLLSAQDPAKVEPPLLRLASGNPRVLTVANAALGGPAHDWSLASGGHGQLMVASDLQVEQNEAGTALADGVLLELEVRPAAWLGKCEREVAGFQKQWGPRLAVIGSQAGLEQEMARALLGQLVAVARGVDEVRIHAAQRDPDRDRNFDIHVAVAPKPGSSMHRWLQLLVPGKKGALAAATQGDTVQIDFDVAPDRLPLLYEPFLPLLASMSIGDASEPTLAEFRKTIAAMDGSGSAVMGRSGMQMVFGLCDPAGYAAISFDPTRLERTKAVLAKRRIDAEYTVGALVHRDIKVMKSVVATDQPVPLLGNGDGELVGYGAVAGAAFVTAIGGASPKEATKALIDAALDGKLPRRPMAAAGGTTGTPALLTIDVDVAAFLGQLPSQMRERLQGRAAPERVHVALHQTGTTLDLLIQLR